MNEQPEKTMAEIEMELERSAAAAEAAVKSGAANFGVAVRQLTTAIPNSTPVQAINSFGKIGASVGSAVEQAENIWAGTVKNAAPLIRVSQNAVRRVRANPAFYIYLSVAGLLGLVLLARSTRKVPSPRKSQRRLKSSR